jgi:hypothetical protein
MFTTVLLIAAAQPAAASPADVAAEAERFMAAYAGELRAGDRAGIAARYDRRGAWFAGRGQERFQDHAAIAADYAGPRWQPPRAFEWIDLHYWPAGMNAITVTGFFRWTPQDGAPVLFRYRAVLLRQEGALRIRREDEEPVAR